MLQSLEPLKTALSAINKSSISYYSAKSANLAGAWLLYILGFAAFAFIFLCERVFPYHLLGKLANSEAVAAALGSKNEATTFVLAVKLLFAVLGIALIYCGTLLNKLNSKEALIKQTASALDSYIKSAEKDAVKAERLKEVEQKSFDNLGKM